MIYNIFKPIIVELTGTPYSYVDFNIKIHTYYQKGNSFVDNLISIYDGSSFVNRDGIAKVKLDDILVDYMFTNNSNELKKNSGIQNGVELQIPLKSNFEFCEVSVNTQTQNKNLICFAGDYDNRLYISKVPTSPNFLFWNNWISNSNGNIIYEFAGSHSTELVNGLLSCVEVVKLPDVLGVYWNGDRIIEREDDCKKKFYVTYRTKNGRTRTVAFNNGVYSKSKSTTEIDDINRFKNVIHNEINETLTLNTGVLNRVDFDLLNEIVYSDFVLIFDVDKDTNCWYKVKDSTFNDISKSKRVINDYKTITFEKVEIERF